MKYGRTGSNMEQQSKLTKWAWIFHHPLYWVQCARMLASLQHLQTYARRWQFMYRLNCFKNSIPDDSRILIELGTKLLKPRLHTCTLVVWTCILINKKYIYILHLHISYLNSAICIYLRASFVGGTPEIVGPTMNPHVVFFLWVFFERGRPVDQ